VKGKQKYLIVRMDSTSGPCRNPFLIRSSLFLAKREAQKMLDVSQSLFNQVFFVSAPPKNSL